MRRVVDAGIALNERVDTPAGEAVGREKATGRRSPGRTARRRHAHHRGARVLAGDDRGAGAGAAVLRRDALQDRAEQGQPRAARHRPLGGRDLRRPRGPLREGRDRLGAGARLLPGRRREHAPAVARVLRGHRTVRVDAARLVDRRRGALHRPVRRAGRARRGGRRDPARQHRTPGRGAQADRIRHAQRPRCSAPAGSRTSRRSSRSTRSSGTDSAGRELSPRASLATPHVARCPDDETRPGHAGRVRAKGAP